MTNEDRTARDIWYSLFAGQLFWLMDARVGAYIFWAISGVFFLVSWVVVYMRYRKS